MGRHRSAHYRQHEHHPESVLLAGLLGKDQFAVQLEFHPVAQERDAGHSYAGICTGSNFSITTTWTEYKVLFQAASTQTDAVLLFYMGGLIPANKQFLIDNVSFKACACTSGQQLPGIDVGNIIFNNGESCGGKRWVMTDGARRSPPTIRVCITRVISSTTQAIGPSRSIRQTTPPRITPTPN